MASIVASIQPAGEAPLDHAAAMHSPCESCATSPCCSYLPLAGFRAATLSDLDYGFYLLNFEHIELGLTSAGDWSVFYRYPCRYLDRASFACTVHQRPEQPHICQRYNPYKCWYKTALTTSTSSDYVRLDRSRLEYLMTGVRFDAQGNITESPEWAGLLQAFENVYDPPVDHADEPGPGVTAGGGLEPLPIYTFDQLQQPCTGCAAYCCKTLVFPVDRPVDMSGLDYLQFCLGFPGIRLGISDANWAILVDAECRHLQQNRCSVFGLPERPLACRYYDEWRCAYKRQFEQAEEAGVLHVALEQYRQVLGSIGLDRNGVIQRMPLVSDLRRIVNSEGSAPVVQSSAAMGA